MNKTLFNIIFSTFILTALNLSAQDNASEEKKTPDLTFICKKITNGGFELKSRLSLYENKKDLPVIGAKINFIFGTDSLVKIENSLTDKHGYAIAYVDSGANLPKDKDGIITVMADFAGNEKYEATSTELIFTETKIGINFELVDSVKTVFVEASKILFDGSSIPLSEEMVTVSVQRMFSRLPIGDVTLDENGKGSIEFPGGIPGDSLGNLKIVAFMADHELYGNIEYASNIKWGVPKQEVLFTHRALWTQIAPLWMIVSLTVLLTGVWAHYIFVIIQLILVKIKGKKPVVE